MKENFLHNTVAWRSFLSSVARDVKEYDGIYSWSIYKKNQIAFSRSVKVEDLQYLNNFDVFSSFYLSRDDIDILSQNYEVDKHQDNGVVIPIKDFSLVGRKHTNIRTAINRNNRLNFTIEEDFRDYNDTLVFLNRWDDTCGQKHFQSRIGKNKYFFKNQFHRLGISIFIYDGKDLIAFGVLSLPNQDGCSAYVIGKALCYDYKGLSEYADVTLYEKGRKLGVCEVNLGGGKGSVVTYKKKFPYSYEIESFDVKCTRKL